MDWHKDQYQMRPAEARNGAMAMGADNRARRSLFGNEQWATAVLQRNGDVERLDVYPRVMSSR